MVIVDRVLPGIEAPVVRGDNEDGAYRLTQHLLDLGHRSIGMIAGPRGISSSEQRIVGYRRALEDNGISVDPILIRHGDYSQPGGYKITCELLTAAVPFPTALFAANNFIALGVLQALNEAGLRVPEDVSLVGFDELATNSLQPPFLTIADQNPYAIGKEAAALLIQQINGKELHNTDVRLPVEIRVRDSTRPPRADV
jgi:LacI family transcriptional regulator